MKGCEKCLGNIKNVVSIDQTIPQSDQKLCKTYPTGKNIYDDVIISTANAFFLVSFGVQLWSRAAMTI